MAMDARKFRILQAIIDDYILTAIPVGSRTISKKYETGLSSATIRNEMSDLEELGYLDQPHVSAGRVPSAKAYRLYVDRLLATGKIAALDAQSVRSHFADRARQMEDVISGAAQVLSSLTHYTSLAVTPLASEMKVRNVQFVAVSAQSALMVIVTDSGIIRDQVVHVGRDMDADALYSISRMLTDRLSGHSLGEAQRILREMSQTDQSELLTDVAAKLQDAEAQSKGGKLTLGGTSNLLSFPEYSDVEKAKNLLSLLETKDTLLKVLKEHQQMAFTVRIGPETGIPELTDCSLVTATYQLGDQTKGTLGVIGPTRMQYAHVLGVLRMMCDQLTHLFQDKE